MANHSTIKKPLAAVDLFCGVGGLTHGMVKAGIQVVAGIDLDPACRFPFEANNKSRFIHADIVDVSSEELLAAYPANSTRILVGCAPCQRFSRYARRQERQSDQKWGLLEHFSRLVKGVRPTVVSMENVPELTRNDVFREFSQLLRASGYYVTYSNVFCPDYGIPQLRTRLVLFASLLGELKLLPPTHRPTKYRTVKQAIAKLPPLSPGGIDSKDALHRSCKLSELNLERMRASQAGGCWRDWPNHLIAECHKAATGKTYPSVYGRMEWDKPAPTITTQFFGYGNGRFGHPEQDRAISLREGSLLQSFPKSYRFCSKSDVVSFSALGRLIGNAVPVRLGEIIGRSILTHIGEFNG
jgi:DNA (cytosine-5)-methyltransferase 1